MRFAVLLFALLLLLSSAAISQTQQTQVFIYTRGELDAIARGAIAATIAMLVFILSVLQKPRDTRKSWDTVLAQTLLTGIIALIAVLLLRSTSIDSLAIEWLAAAVIGAEGPNAMSLLREKFDAIWRR